MARNSTTPADTTENNTMTEPVDNAEQTDVPAEKAPRIRRSPRERAQDKLDAANTRLTKSSARLVKLRSTIEDVERDVRDAQAEADFRAQSSHLND